jgi:transcriptional regulator with XRE-family HTH domain
MAKRKGWERLAAQLERRGQRTRLAQRLGVSKQFVSQLCSGKLKPSLTLATKLEDETGIPAREFSVL